MVRIATTPKLPRRLFRDRRAARAAMDAAIGPIPLEAEQLRHAVEIIDPQAIYSFENPEDGQVVSVSGAEMLETAKVFLAVADAHEAGDESALRRALRAFLALK